MESVDTERTSSLRPGGREATSETHAGLNINIDNFVFIFCLNISLVCQKLIAPHVCFCLVL